MSVALCCKNLTLSHQPQPPLLKNISMDLCQGEMLALIGKNGTGKTTLLKACLGILPIASGEIRINNIPLSSLRPTQLTEHIAVVFTDKLHLPYLTAREVVALGRFPFTNLWGRLSKKDQIHIDATIDLLGITSIQHDLFENLSDGQKQKIILGRALAQNTSILVLDEPTTYLDLTGKREILSLLLKISQEHKRSILFSTHEWHLLREFDLPVAALMENNLIKAASANEFEKAGYLAKAFKPF